MVLLAGASYAATGFDATCDPLPSLKTSNPGINTDGNGVADFFQALVTHQVNV